MLSRKADLHIQISNAIEVNNEKLLFVLEGLWVHRYGIQSLRDYKCHDSDAFAKVSNDEKRLDEKKYLPLVNLHKATSDTSVLIEEIDGQEQAAKSIESVDSSISIERKITVENKGSSDSESCAEEATQQCPLEAKPYQGPPPPPPSISHLRRWLPTVEDKMPEAS